MERSGVSRRRFIGAGSVVALGSVAGCEGVFGGSATSEPESANFTFEYAPEKRRLTITHEGGGAVPADALSISSSRGTRVAWSELGSTAETGNEAVTSGASAVLGPTIINWDQPVTRTELIRVVFTREDDSVTTLGRFESDLTPTGTPTATPSPTPPAGVIYSDDFEDGTLDDYTVVSFPGSRPGGSFELTRSPSRGEYAVRTDTNSKYLRPDTAPTLEPPLTFSLDFYVDGAAGLDVALQWDSERNVEYVIKLRSNFNGTFVEVVKWDRSYETGDVTYRNRGSKTNGAFAQRRWETVTISWKTDGTIRATVESTGKSSQMTDTELSGNPFHFIGYEYEGWAAFDNVLAER
jgi:hypothetical protein